MSAISLFPSLPSDYRIAAFAAGNIAIFTLVDLFVTRMAKKFEKNNIFTFVANPLLVGGSFFAANLGLSILTQADLSGVVLTAIAISAIAIRVLWLLCRTDSKSHLQPSSIVKETTSSAPVVKETTSSAPIHDDKPLVKKDFKVIFVFDSKEDAPIINNLKEVPGMPKEFETVTKQDLVDRSEEFKKEGSIICLVNMPGGRPGDEIENELGKIINSFGRDKAILLVITSKGPINESDYPPLIKNLRYVDSKGAAKDCLVFWDEKKIDLRLDAKAPNWVEHPEKHLAKLNKVIKSISES